MKSNVLLITNLPSSYFVEYANELGRYLDLTVVFERDYDLHKKKASGYNFDSMTFKTLFLTKSKSKKEDILTFKLRFFLKKQYRKYNRIVFCNPCSPTSILAELYCIKKNIPYCVQSEGGFPKNGNGIKEKIKKIIYKNASLYLTGMLNENNYFLHYGAKENKLRKYNFSSLHESDIQTRVIAEEEKQQLRKKLGINGKRLVLCVSQVIQRKGIDTLIRAAAEFNDDVAFYVIGGKPDYYYSSLIKDLKIRNFYFVKRISKDLLSLYYKAADLFILLTREDVWGLVINEAMAYGLPVITTNKCLAGVQLIKDLENGFIIDSDDYKLARDKIIFLLNDEKLRKRIAIANLKKIKNYTIERMAETIANYLK